MPTNTIKEHRSPRKTARRIFMALMGLHGLVEIVVGLSFLFILPQTLESGFGITYNSQLDILGIVIGLMLLLLGVLSILSIMWTNKGQVPGIVVGVVVGAYLFTFGVVAYLKFGQIQAIYVDGIRGALTIIMGYLAYRELGNQKA